MDIITSRNFKSKNLYWRNNPDILQNGKEAMIDMLCLSKCKMVLKTSSALSSFSKIINPDLKIYRVNACKMFADIPYFPDAYIPLLEKNTRYHDYANTVLEKVQKEDWSFSHKNRFYGFSTKPRYL
jgi:hypothetical protein